MSSATSPVSGKPYGLAAVCRVWRLARSGIYRHQSPPPATAARRRGPLGAMSDDALTTAIRGVLAASPFHGEGHRKVWAELVKVPPAQRVEYQRRGDCAMREPAHRCDGCCG